MVASHHWRITVFRPLTTEPLFQATSKVLDASVSAVIEGELQNRGIDKYVGIGMINQMTMRAPMTVRGIAKGRFLLVEKIQGPMDDEDLKAMQEQERVKEERRKRKEEREKMRENIKRGSEFYGSNPNRIVIF